jgi:hypothetical protein
MMSKTMITSRIRKKGKCSIISRVKDTGKIGEGFRGRV